MSLYEHLHHKGRVVEKTVGGALLLPETVLKVRATQRLPLDPPVLIFCP